MGNPRVARTHGARAGWALATVAAILPACFAEVGGGYYPSTHQTLTDPAAIPPVVTGSAGAWSAFLKVGFYFDIPITPAQSGVGLAWSPNGWGTDLVINRSKRGPADAAGDGTVLRVDATLPVNPIPPLPRVRLRLVSEYGWYTDGGTRLPGKASYTNRTGASGHRWFVGPALSFTTVGGSFIAAVGAQRMTVSIPVGTQRGPELGDFGLSTSAWGVGGSLTITLTPGSPYGGVSFASSSVVSDHDGPKAGCAYVDHCDQDGHCTSQYVCP
jgi:hypothetical protein